MNRALVLGTRGSKLAMTQSAAVASALEAVAPVTVSLLEVSTEGDRSQAALETLGGTGVFVTALRERLLAGDIDLAVHSLKDLPTEPAAGLVVAAIPVREDPRDALVARDGLTLNELPAGSRIGTGSPRRTAQLRALGLGFEVVPIRGNVDTRLAKVSSGELDAVVLARAGLARLGRLDDITEVLDPLTMLPAPGQGALAVECRADDPELATMLALLDDGPTRAAVLAERTLLAELEAGCTAPVGAYAEVAEGDQGLEIYLRGVVVTLDGSTDLRLSATGPFDDAEAVGRRLAADLLDAGAADLMGREP
ncbi:MAG: hydroxymethylbilane synthase [Frankiales bacterium]|nr:hydroxymethylbilane synthase [Frankiales bacterium]